MRVEICATSVQSAKNAELGGAERIELCTELGIGGITPSYGSILQILEEIKIPVFVLIRPRSGNFVYSEAEFQAMIKDIELCKDLGCDGIVSGILTPENEVDVERTKKLLHVAYPMSFTFHRAFDQLDDPILGLKALIDVGVNRILSSGQAESAEKGLDFLVQFKELSNGILTILPGGGINPQNIQLFKEKGFEEVHASASTIFSENISPKISMNSSKFLDESKHYVSDLELIKEMVNV